MKWIPIALCVSAVLVTATLWYARPNAGAPAGPQTSGETRAPGRRVSSVTTSPASEPPAPTLPNFPQRAPSNQAGEVARLVREGDLEGAKRLLASGTFFEGYETTLAAFAVELAKLEPKEGLMWLQGLEKNAATQLAIHSFATAVSGQSPEQVSALRALLTHPSQKAAFDGAVANVLARKSPQEAIDLIMKGDLPASEKKFIMASLPMAFAHDPQAVVNFALQYPKDASPDTVGDVVANVYKKDRAEGERLLAQLPDGLARGKVYRNIVQRAVTEADPRAASEWLAQLPPTKAKDSGIAEFVSLISERQPQEAWQWANSISQDRYRLAVIENTLKRTASFDRAGAAEFLAKARLNDKDRARLLKSYAAETPR